MSDRKPYLGNLTAEQAATAMQAARLNAIELLETADTLFSLKRFPHSLVFSTLAIEEAGKPSILLAIYLGIGCKGSGDWKSYRQHKAKTEMLNINILTRIRAEFPDIPFDEAGKIALNGPSPDQLESMKQLSIYSDCLMVSGRFLCHLPKTVDWREKAWSRLSEAKAIILGLKDRTPEELNIWMKHVKAAKKIGRSLVNILPEVQRELVDKKLIKQGSWDTLLKDIKAESIHRPKE